MRQRGKLRFRLTIVRGSLDALKPRVLKRRAQRHAAHIDGMVKRLNGAHDWARAYVRMREAFGGSTVDRYRPEEV